MKYFVDILKQFTTKQRLFVLIILLVFTTGNVLLSQYFKTDDCRPYIEENFKMHEDFAKISKMLREERMKTSSVMVDTIMVAGEPVGGSVPVNVNNDMMLDSVLKIVESHEKD